VYRLVVRYVLSHLVVGRVQLQDRMNGYIENVDNSHLYLLTFHIEDFNQLKSIVETLAQFVVFVCSGATTGDW